jgi:hypothetical protein
MMIFSPKRSILCETILEQKGVYANLIIRDMKMGFLGLETDVFSMERPDAFSSLYLDKDSMVIFELSQALKDYQAKEGGFTRIISKGPFSKLLVQSLVKPKTGSHTLIALDRSIDFMTPLLTQLTYEGLLDELFGIQSSNWALFVDG